MGYKGDCVTDETNAEPIAASALAKTSKGNPRESTAQMVVGLVLFLGLAGWGVFSLASCTYRGAQAVVADFNQFAEEQERAEAADRARAKASAGMPSDVQMIAAAQSAVKRQLVDDRSARFRDVTVETASGTKVVCGQVNSRNRAGGFGGYQHFVSNGLDQLTFLEENRSDFAKIWNAVCVS